MAPQEKSVSQLPLISDCHVVSAKNPHSGETLVLTLHLRSLGGTVYQVPLSIRAAKAMLLALASWEVTLQFYETIGCGTSPSQALATTPSTTRSLPSAMFFRREF